MEKLYKVELKDGSESKSEVEGVKEELINLCDEVIVEGDSDWSYEANNTSGYKGDLYINKNNGKVRVHI